MSPMPLLSGNKFDLLSALEAERDKKRRTLEQLHTQWEAMKTQMQQLETDLMGLDKDIDEVECELDAEDNFNRTSHSNIRVKQELEVVVHDDSCSSMVLLPEVGKHVAQQTQADEILTDPGLTAFSPMKHDEILTEFTQTQHHERHYEHDDDDEIYDFPRVSTSSIESLPLTTSAVVATKKKKPPPPNSNKNSSSDATTIQANGTLEAYLVKSYPGQKQNPVRNLYEQQQQQQQSSSSNNIWDPHAHLKSTSFPWSQEVDRLLRHTFKIQAFRDHQKEIINATLSGDDVFVIMRTGGGKSLTYQLPALLEGRGPQKKVTFVVSPLLSLIQDQEEQMNQFFPGSATAFTSGLAGGNTEHAKRWATVRDPDAGVCLVFVTPEKVSQSNKLCSEMEKLFAQGRLGRFVIDECHCACQWGHDFRPDYALLGKLKSHFPSIPVIAVTATASERVREDVCKILRIGDNYQFFRSTANRPNLHYSIRPKSENKDQVIIDLVEFIKEKYPRGAGIVYTYSKKDADQVAGSLCDYGIIARAYHSDISSKQKELIHRSWMRNQTQVVVATIAFGLGINKPDVRFVLHHSMSKTLEAYYQESGRAGRDGNFADCVLFYSPKDFTRLLKMVHGTSSERLLLPMVRYAQEQGNDAVCKAIILKHLGEPDCRDVNEVLKENEGITNIKRDVGKHAKTVVQLLNLRLSQGNKITAAMLVKEWRSTAGNSPDFVKENPPGKDGLLSDDCDRIIISLILENVLQTSPVWNAYDTIIYLTTGPNGSRLLNSKDPHVVVKLPKRENRTSLSSVTKASKQATTRKAIANDGEWLTAKSGTKKKATASKKKTTKKSKATKTKTRKPTKKAATIKTISSSQVKSRPALPRSEVIELLDVDSSASENEFAD